jgi:hypothetical protein
MLRKRKYVKVPGFKGRASAFAFKSLRNEAVPKCQILEPAQTTNINGFLTVRETMPSITYA